VTDLRTLLLTWPDLYSSNSIKPLFP